MTGGPNIPSLRLSNGNNSNHLRNTGSLIEIVTGIPTNSLIFEANRNGEILTVKGQLKISPDWPYDSLVGTNIMDNLHLDDLERFENIFRSVINGNVKIAENFNLDYEGIIQMTFTLLPKTSNEGIIEGVFCILKQVIYDEEVPVISFNNLQEFPNNSQELTGVFNQDGLITYQSHSNPHLFGYKKEEVINKEFTSFIHPDNKNLFINMLTDLTQKSDIPITTEISFIDKSGIWNDYEVTFTNLLDHPDVKGILYICRNITEHKKSQSEILYLSNHDEFTGLPNRKAFEERVNLEIKLATSLDKKFAVFFLSLEGFEFLNEMINHHLGDIFIKDAIADFKKKFNEHIGFMAKVSDSGFFILTKKLEDSTSIINFSKAIISFLSKSISFREHKIQLSPKIGISVFPNMGTEAMELIMNSKSALYLSSDSSTEDYRVTSSKDLEAMSRLFSLKKDLKHAVANDQLRMYYQPIYQAKTSLIESVEALIRWEHPAYGLVYPDEFIYLAEKYELIDSIGGWVLETVFRDLARWHAKGIFVRGAINVSPKQLANPDFIDTISKIVEETTIKPRWVDIEITENYKLEDSVSLQKIKELQELGFNISLDDFGTGYNSLKNLQIIKPNKLKIDRLFTMELLSSTAAENIISSVIQLARDLSVVVVAEGVETEEQRQFLISQDCDYLQGYLFSRPVTTASIERMIERQWCPDSNC